MISQKEAGARVPAQIACANAIARNTTATKEAAEKADKPIPQDAIPAPVVFLHSLFQTTDIGRRIIETPSRCSFQKPCQGDIDAYDLDTVRAIREGSVPKLRELLKEGKSFDACNRFGESLFHMACRRGNLPVIKFMVFEAHVRVESRDDFGRTPLHDACWTAKPNFDVMDLLLSAAPPELLLAEDVRGHSPFHYARKEHWEQWVNFLEERKESLLRRVSSISAIG